MSKDPPENLYQRLNELEATVRGLTQELVEAHERIRQLESKTTDHRPENGQSTPDNTTSKDEKDTTEETQLEDDIIVA